MLNRIFYFSFGIHNVSEFFPNCFLNIFFEIEFKRNLHGWTFRRAGRVEKSKIKLNFLKMFCLLLWHLIPPPFFRGPVTLLYFRISLYGFLRRLRVCYCHVLFKPLSGYLVCHISKLCSLSQVLL